MKFFFSRQVAGSIPAVTPKKEEKKRKKKREFPMYENL